MRVGENIHYRCRRCGAVVPWNEPGHQRGIKGRSVFRNPPCEPPRKEGKRAGRLNPSG
jgi:hypothetical protein